MRSQPVLRATTAPLPWMRYICSGARSAEDLTQGPYDMRGHRLYRTRTTAAIGWRPGAEGPMAAACSRSGIPQAFCRRRRVGFHASGRRESRPGRRSAHRSCDEKGPCCERHSHATARMGMTRFPRSEPSPAQPFRPRCAVAQRVSRRRLCGCGESGARTAAPRQGHATTA